MYSSSHAAVGTALVLGGYSLGGEGGAIIGSLLAITSHLFVDKINEKPYGDLTSSVVWEAIPMIIFAACAFISGMPWLFLVGWVSGNLMDIIDKKLYLAMFFDKIKPWNFFHRSKPSIKLDLETTKLYAGMSCMAYVVMAMLVGSGTWNF